MTNLPPQLVDPLFELLLSIADDKLMLGSRNADWTGLAPILEEDIAFSALAQDDIAHAASLYELAASLRGDAPDRLAYGRRLDEYRCAEIVTLHDDFDWAVALVRQFFCEHFNALRIERLARSAFQPLAALAARIQAEQNLSTGHADTWLLRLATGTAESRGRVEAALERIAPYTPGLFEPTAGLESLEQAGIYPPAERPMWQSWRERVQGVLQAAHLPADLAPPAADFVGPRRGRHGPALAALLDEMTEVYRVEPNATW